MISVCDLNAQLSKHTLNKMKQTKAERREGRKKNRKYVLHNKNAVQIYSDSVKKREAKYAEKAKGDTG